MWVCRLPVHIDPAGCTGFTEILGKFVTSHWADSVVGPYGEASMHTYPVGADDSVRPQTAPVFTGIYGESVAAQRADVGIGPYMTPANSCCPANFECKAFLPQSFKGSCYQIWCIVTGGAYLSAREVTWCVRNDYKNRFLPELYPQDAPNASQRPFSPPSFPARRKRWGRRRRVGNALLVCGLGLASTDT